ncbi:MAG: cell division protein FtsZ, partial [Candidatus Eisenbacteria bacterium]|nr:cell division protein FtsZ [Candidatus Eisenbacteria bacterium]
MLIDVSETRRSPAVLKVIGLGGGGGNAVNRMLASEIRGVEFLVANTDVQALEGSLCANRVPIGEAVTHGLGSGGNPDLGRAAAEEDLERLRECLRGADMVFIAAGMGGGTGTGASPIVAQAARELGALTVGIVTKPFGFEGRLRMRQAEAGIEELRQAVDTLIVIPNQRLLHVVDKATPLNDALRVADDVLTHATKGISEIITVRGLINVDFADVRSIMAGMGNALMGMGFGRGPDRARQAADMAICSPLLEDISIAGAQGILVNFTGGEDLTLAEVDEAATLILDAAGPDANVIIGAVLDPSLS